MNRRDYLWWRLHLIIRGTGRDPQYGALLWRARNTQRRWTLDVWVKQTLFTLRARDWF